MHPATYVERWCGEVQLLQVACASWTEVVGYVVCHTGASLAKHCAAARKHLIASGNELIHLVPELKGQCGSQGCKDA